MILGIIPARGGSKGIPRKNLHELAGQPLLKWTLDAAKRSELLDDFFVSTEDDEIAEYTYDQSANVVHRPDHLATDGTTTAEVLRYHAGQCNAADVVVLLQPTSPIRFRGLIDRCIGYFQLPFNECDTLATGFRSYQYPYGTMDNIPRQEMQSFFYDDGNIYVHKAAHLKEGKWWGEKRHEVVIEPWYNIELDTIADFWMAEGIIWQLNK